MRSRKTPLEPLAAAPGELPPEYDVQQARLAPHMRRLSPFYTLARVRRAMLWAGLAASLLATGFVAGRFVRDARTGVEQVRLVSQGSQLAGAERLHRAQQSDEVAPLSHLQEDGYLRAVPPGWKDGEDLSHAQTVPVAPEVCEAVNRRAGMAPGKRVVEVVRDPALEQTAKFGCVTETLTVFFKY